MAISRRQFVLGLAASLLTNDPLQAASSLLEKATSPGWLSSPDISAAVLEVCHRQSCYTRAFGHSTSNETVFGIASITKPMVATAAMVLSDNRQIKIQDRVVKFLPEFSGEAREQVTIRHLLTHTAGLPDILPSSQELLRKQAPLTEFFLDTCKTPLLFKPGTEVSYSNLGVLVVMEVIERLTGVPLLQFLREHVFLPLSMTQTSLGLGGRRLQDIASPQFCGPNKNPSSVYQHDLGAPWGGVHSTVSDVTRFLNFFMNPNDTPIWTNTAYEMLRNQTEGLNEPWGLGWMLANSHDVYFGIRPSWRRYGWSYLVANPLRLPAFGVNCSARTFGHYGVSGTIAWA